MQKNNDDVKLTLRDYTPNDRHFILATWLRGLFYGDTWFSQIPKAIFMENYHRALERVFSTPGVKIKVACLADDKDVILGYSVYRTLNHNGIDINVLDWVFVKSAWRKIGLAKKLIPPSIEACTHLTKSGTSIIKCKLPNVIFNPFLFK